MNKKELVKVISEKASTNGAVVTLSTAEACLSAFMDAVTEELASKGNVALIGFGTFSTNLRAAREGRNPSNGNVIQIPEKYQAKFKVGKKLEEAINE